MLENNIFPHLILGSNKNKDQIKANIYYVNNRLKRNIFTHEMGVIYEIITNTLLKTGGVPKIELVQQVLINNIEKLINNKNGLKIKIND
jgi:hypothetical protein